MATPQVHHPLISSQKVAGTKVENVKGDSLGHIEELMIDKETGHVAYAVLKYGSFLGLGGKLFALPWHVLNYDTTRDAYVVDIAEARLKNAPSYEAGCPADMTDPSWTRKIDDYYRSAKSRSG